jgi:hypothetical protein
MIDLAEYSGSCLYWKYIHGKQLGELQLKANLGKKLTNKLSVIVQACGSSYVGSYR